MYDIIVVGGGPAGLTAAVYARRQGKSVLVIEKNAFGGQTVFSPKIENYPGCTEISGTELADRMVGQVIAQGGELTVEEVTGISEAEDGLKKVVTDFGEYLCRAVIIAAGARHRMLGIDGEDELIGNGISFCAVCDGAFYRDRDVLLIGGGNSALVEAVHLAELCRSLTIVQNLPFLTGEQKLIENVTKRQNVNVIFNSVVKSLRSENGRFTGAELLNTETGTVIRADADGMFVAIGLIPDTDMLRDTVPLDGRGYVLSDENCLTDVPGVFVAGDCRVKKIRQIATACADGAVAALAACDYIG